VPSPPCPFPFLHIFKWPISRPSLKRAMLTRSRFHVRSVVSLEQFNELESTIAALREEKGRLEYSLNAQIEACDSLSEANE
jgi:uncharacterized small protein (DUF1192 family)